MVRGVLCMLVSSCVDDVCTGDIVGITVMGQPTVILGSAQVASELLDARGNVVFCDGVHRPNEPQHPSSMCRQYLL